MGLFIRSLAKVPDTRRSYYVYLLDYGWHEPLGQALYDNFQKMAAIASDHDAVVVRSAEDSVHFSSDVFSWHSINGVNAETALPAIMITDRHPHDFRANRFTEEGDAGDYKILLFPLKKYCKTTADVVAYVEKIFSDIAEKRNLADFRIVKEMKKGLGSALVDGIVLEPNIGGWGINLKPIVDYFRSK